MGLNPIGNSNWARETTDLVEKYVGLVRDNATNRVESIVKGLVFGVIGLMLAPILAVLGLVVLTRGVQWVLGRKELLGFMKWFHMDHSRAVWVSYVSIGIIFTAAGLFFIAKARRPAASD